MKKMNVLLSTLSIVVAMLAPMTSYAADVEFARGVKSMELSREYDASYTITIPEGTNKLAVDEDFEITASAFMNYGEEMVVSVSSANSWNLVDKNHGENKESIPYSMKSDTTAVLENGTDILVLPYTAKSGAVTLTVTGIEEAVYAGTYHDELTFTVAINDNSASTSGTTDTAG